MDLYGKEKKRGPNIRIPPAFFVAGFLVALLMHATVRPVPLVETAPAWLGTVGWMVALAGFLVSLSGIATFSMAGTTMFPFVPASALVQHGPYRFTRNPMYLGNTISYLGFALVVNSAWPLFLLPLVLLGLYRLVIAEEEKYLTATFGDAYLDYKRKVRRWI